MANDQQGSDGESLSPFWLKKAFPDAQGIFDAQHSKLSEIRDDCFVALDANVLLLPYKLEDIGLSDVVDTYRQLSDERRLIVPAQAAREFASHRSVKVAEVVKYLRDQAALSGPVLRKKVGALTGHAGYKEALEKVRAAAAVLKEAQVAISAVASEMAADVAEDPVSKAYRELFAGAVVDDPDDCSNEAVFRADLKARYDVRRPPGYKDAGKADEGAGDLILWKTVLAEGARRKANCILVTGEEKPDWHVQSSGPFQPRLELLEEYRVVTGKTLHIIPLSRLLELYRASPNAIEEVKRAELSTGRSSRGVSKILSKRSISHPKEYLLESIERRNEAVTSRLIQLYIQERGNWTEAEAEEVNLLRKERESLRMQKRYIDKVSRTSDVYADKA